MTDVPDISRDWYRGVVEFADGNPEPVQWFVGHFTEVSIIMLGVLFLLAAYPRLRGGPRDRALALLTPATVVLAYGGSEGLKLLVGQYRPCQVLVDLTIVAERCPTAGDWSFPSNHSTIAGALAAAILLLHRRMGWYAAPLALLAAASRVYLGVHYPHDVLAGLLIGVTVVTLCTLLLLPLATSLLSRSALPAPPTTP